VSMVDIDRVGKLTIAAAVWVGKLSEQRTDGACTGMVSHDRQRGLVGPMYINAALRLTTKSCSRRQKEGIRQGAALITDP
jgi:hypothetical protein